MAFKSSNVSSMNHRGSGGDNNKNTKKRSSSTTITTTTKNSKVTTGSSNSNKKAKHSTNNSSSSNYRSETKTNNSKQPTSNTSSSSSSSSVLHPRKNADIVEQGKRLWNCLRCKTNTPTQIRDYMNELFPLIQNKVMELTMQHDASRIVQAAIQFGNIPERQQIVQELCPLSSSISSSTTATSTTTTTTTTTTKTKHTFLDVCQSQYAHFVVLKLLKYCYKDPICLQLLINAFKGNMMKLITHTNGCRIVEVLMQSNMISSSSSNYSSTAVIIPKDKIAILKQEIYGPHYAVFAQDTLQQLVTLVRNQEGSKNTTKPSKDRTYVTPTLARNIALLPEKKSITMEHIRNNIILKGIDKQLYGYYYFQEIMYEYIYVLMMDEDYATIRDLTSTTSITDHTIHLLASKYGTKVVCQFIAYSTVKERKRIVKSLKGYAKSALFHKDAYLVLIRLLQCVDDTVVLHKNVLQELLSSTNASSLSLSNTKTNSDTTATTTKNINSVLSISKSNEIVHATNDDSSSDHQERPTLLEIALLDTASKFLLSILIPTPTSTADRSTTSTSTHTSAVTSSHTKIFSPYEQEVLHPSNPYIMEKVTPATTSNADPGSDNNVTTISKNGVTVQKVYTSKKDPELRRNEILQYFHVPLLQQLCCTKEQYVFELLRSIPGSNVLYHLYVATIQALTADPDRHKNSDSVVPKKTNHQQLSQLLNDMIRMICLVCRNNLTISSSVSNQKKNDDTSERAKENIFEHVVGHRVIKNLILYDASIGSTNDNDVSSTECSENIGTTTKNIPSFTEMFVQEFASDFMSMIEYNRGAFILVALLQVSWVRARVLDDLNVTTILQESNTSSSSKQKEKSTSTSSTAGLHALRQEINKTL